MSYVVQDTMSWKSDSNNERDLNTVFEAHSSRPVLCYYSIKISVSSTLILTESGSVVLMAGESNPSVEMCRCELILNNTTISVDVESIGLLSYISPPGHKIELVTSGNADFEIVSQREIVL